MFLFYSLVFFLKSIPVCSPTLFVFNPSSHLIYIHRLKHITFLHIYLLVKKLKLWKDEDSLYLGPNFFPWKTTAYSVNVKMTWQVNVYCLLDVNRWIKDHLFAPSVLLRNQRVGAVHCWYLVHLRESGRKILDFKLLMGGNGGCMRETVF